MFDCVDPRNPTAMYAQIADCLRVAVAAGELASGERLPSVRQLSRTLGVSPATVVRAFRALGSEGIVELRQGSGCFVASLAQEQPDAKRRREARRLVRGLLKRAASTQLTAGEVRLALDAELPREGQPGRPHRG